MAQNQELRVQFIVPSAPTSASGVKLYINPTSGLNIVGQDGIHRFIGGNLTGNLPLSAMRTGGNGICTVGTGGIAQVLFTSFSGASIQTGLGQPSFFIPFVGADGFQYGVPAYPLK